MPVIVADIVDKAQTTILSNKTLNYAVKQPIVMAVVMTLLALLIFYFIDSKFKATFWLGLIFLGVLVIQRVILKRDRFVGSGESYKLSPFATGPRVRAEISDLPDEYGEQQFSITADKVDNDEPAEEEDNSSIGGGSSLARILNAPSVF